MPKITIHTATYNRGYILGKAYESLKKQTNKDFEWIITDDGSTDNTETLVSAWMKEDNGFPLFYNKLEHVGIPRALNSGVSKARSEWFMMLDSDDCLLPEAVEKIIPWIEEVENDPSFCGIGFARCFPNGEYMKKQVPVIDPALGYVDASHIERKKYNLDMDMCEVQRVSMYKRFPFQYWDSETYAPEQLCFYEMALAGYTVRWHAEKLYICDYLPDGQTRDDHLVKRNPMGFAMMYNQNILLSNSFKEKCINTVRMTALAIYAKHPGYILQSNAKFLACLTFPAGAMLALRRMRQYKRLK